MRRSTVRVAASDVSSRSPRGAPTDAQVLLPVWGQSYVQQFLQFGLPTLLSPGNLPYLADKLSSRLVILTSSEDMASLLGSPLMARVRALGCEVDVRPIDHLITHTNQSTTVTLAITEAIVNTGPKMVDTCFFPAMSDYIYATGSLQNVVERMMAGTSAVVVGNFQVVRETALPSLRRILELSGQAPVLHPRELMAWGLVHLHPATVANTVNIRFNHNSHTNRLFWRVNETTILGRFYLRHPICLRPETPDFIVGSSLDYSFIPEMCPSGNVSAITDSDEYFVIEMQPADHEFGLLRYGPLRPNTLAKSLSEWTTKEHRANVSDVHIFHSQDLPGKRVEEVTREADVFVAAVAEKLKGRPRPHRGHTYWKGAIAAFSVARSPQYRDQPLRQVYGLEHMSTLSRSWRRRESLVFGAPPRVRPWDHQWPDYTTLLAEVGNATRSPGCQLLVVSDRPTVLSVSLSSGPGVQRVRTDSIARNPPTSPESLGAPFGACLLELPEGQGGSAKVLLQRAQTYVVPGGRLLVNTKVTHANALRLAALTGPGLNLLSEHLVPQTAVRQGAQRASRSLHHLAAGRPWLGLPLALVVGPPVLAASVLANLRSVGTRQKARRVNSYSSVVMVFEASSVGGQYQSGPKMAAENIEAALASAAEAGAAAGRGTAMAVVSP